MPILIGLALVLGLAGFNLFYGHAPTDDGFVLGFAWRIWNGQVPHRDFITIRPPLTPLLHQIWFALPERMQFPAARFSFYLWMGAIWAFGALRLIPLIFEARREWRNVGLAVFTFSWLYAVHNFPPTPWHSIDGLVLSSVALFLLVEGVLRWERGRATPTALWFFTGLLSGLAPFTKQSFVPTPALVAGLFAVSVWKIRAPRALWLRSAGALVGGMAIGPLLIFGYLAAHGAMAAFLRQTRASSTPGIFKTIAIDRYVHVNRSQLRGWGFGLLSGWLLEKGRPRWALAAALAPIAFILYRSAGSVDPGFFFSSPEPFACFLTFTALTLGLRARARRLLASDLALGLGALGVAWMVSISMGYNFPILGFSGLGLFLGLCLARSPALPDSPPRAVRAVATGLAAVMAGVILILNYFYPYGEEPRPAQRHDVARIYPRFGPRLWIGDASFDLIRSAHDLTEKAKRQSGGRPIIVYPMMPLYSYLERKTNPFPLDWWISLDYPTYEGELIARLDSIRPLIVYQLRSVDARDCKQSVYAGTAISNWIEAHSRLIERDGIYCLLDTAEASRKDGKAASLLETIGAETGQAIANSGSFQRIPASEAAW